MKNLTTYINEKLKLSDIKLDNYHSEKKYFYQYFYNEALEDRYYTEFSGVGNSLQYSIDNCQTWNRLKPNTKTPYIFKGERIYFKGTNMNVDSNYGIGRFKPNDKKFNVGGNIMSLIYGDDFKRQTKLLNKYQFNSLFYMNNYLISAKDLILPATELTEYCYNGMFNHCISLITVPELPAMELVKNCYSSMFYECFELTEWPELPATELVKNCYSGMFGRCESLVEAPELYATKLAEGCYKYMFEGCKSLREAPELPATKLVEECYSHMFYYCTSLTEITMLATDISSNECLLDWVKGVSKTGTFTKSKNVNILEEHSGIPKGWTVKEI